MAWQKICSQEQLVENSGICALVEEHQIAVFYLPQQEPQLYAIGNWDPVGKANVLSRGIVGSIDQTLVVASPLYKHHFCLLSGDCLEQEVSVPTYPIKLIGEDVSIAI